MNKLFTLLAFFASSIITFGQQAGSLDSTFANKGVFEKDMSNPDICTRTTSPYKLFKVSDGSILSIDFYSPVGGRFEAIITKIKQNGAIDTNFGTNGRTVLNAFINSDIMILDIYEASDGSFIFVISLYGNTRIAKIDAKGKILDWKGYFTSPNGYALAGKTLSSLFTSNKKLLIGTNLSTALMSDVGKIDTSFTCKVKNVLASYETPQGYVLFSFNNKKIIRIPIDAKGVQSQTQASDTIDFPYNPYLETQTSHNLFTQQISSCKKLNDSLFHFIILVENQTIKSFVLNIKTKFISEIKDHSSGFYFYSDEKKNIWVNGNYSVGLNLNPFTGAILPDHDTLWTSKYSDLSITEKSTISDFKSSTYLTYKKSIHGKITFGQNDSVKRRIFYDFDAPVHSIKLSNAYLVNSISGAVYSRLYKLDYNGNLQPVNIEGLKAHPYDFPESQLIQNGDQIVLINDSAYYLYDEPSNTFQYHKMLNSKIYNQYIGPKGSFNDKGFYPFKKDHLIITNYNSAIAINIITGDTVPAFSGKSKLSLPYNSSSSTSISAAYRVHVNPNGKIFLFNNDGSVYNAQNQLSVNTYPGYIWTGTYNNGNYVLMKSINPDSISLKFLNKDGTEIGTSPKIKAESNLYFDFNRYQSNTYISNTFIAKYQIDGKLLLALRQNLNTFMIRLNSDFSIDDTFADHGYLKLNGVSLNIDINMDKLFVFASNWKIDYNQTDNTIYKINLGAVVLAVDDDTYQSTELLYPNPTSGLLKFNSDHFDKNQAELFNIMGHSVSRKVIDNNSLDISELQKGMYMVKIGKQSFKVIKE